MKIYEKQQLTKLDDFFLPMSQRTKNGVFCYRINGHSPEIEDFISRYDRESCASGLTQLGKLPNPTDGNLTYFKEILGDEFQLNGQFFSEKLEKWLPRLTSSQNECISLAFYETLLELEQLGKNHSILKNIYTKFMCWMYYRLEKLLRQLGKDIVPKILYEGNISDYELRLFTICAKAGCDFVLLQRDGDESYKKLDSNNLCTFDYHLEQLNLFPPSFSVELLREVGVKKAKQKNIYPPPSKLVIEKNRWKKKDSLGNCRYNWQDILTSSENREDSEIKISTCFLALVGTEDKVTYLSEIFRFQQQLQKNNRTVFSLSQLSPPTPQEIEKIHRKNYENTESLLSHLLKNIVFPKFPEIEKLMQTAFLDCFLDDKSFSQMNLKQQEKQAIYVISWILRYQYDIFDKWTLKTLPCFIWLNGAQNETELLFLDFLSKLPLDILVLAPNLEKQPLIPISMLKEEHLQSYVLEKFPELGGETQMNTMAYFAERDLDQLMYTDSGMYRDFQFQKAKTVVLRTMYEEIDILWDTELKFRPNFDTLENTVHLPVLFAKVSGVKDGNIASYWSGIRKLMTAETLLVSSPPMVNNINGNPISDVAPQFYKGGKLQKNLIFSHPQYTYGFLRQETQDYILEKLSLMLSEKNIKGMGQNGTEYMVIATALHLQKDILRMIQSFDFTKKNPKVIYLHTKEGVPPLEDGILLGFLSHIGFDIVTFVPTGYQGIEVHFQQSPMLEHQIGGYLYDLHPPKLTKTEQPFGKFGKKIFKKGG